MLFYYLVFCIKKIYCQSCSVEFKASVVFYCFWECNKMRSKRYFSFLTIIICVAHYLNATNFFRDSLCNANSEYYKTITLKLAEIPLRLFGTDIRLTHVVFWTLFTLIWLLFTIVYFAIASFSKNSFSTQSDSNEVRSYRRAQFSCM